MSHRPEDESPVRGDPRNAAHAQVQFLGPAVPLAKDTRSACCRCGTSSRDRGTGTRELPLSASHTWPAVRAPVDQQVHLAALVPGHHHVLGGQLLADVVERLRHLALVPDEYPGCEPDLAQFSAKICGSVYSEPWTWSGLIQIAHDALRFAADAQVRRRADDRGRDHSLLMIDPYRCLPYRCLICIKHYF